MATDTATELAAAMIPLAQVHEGSNVRRTLPDVAGLAASIKRHGMLSAVTVNRRDDGEYDLVAGFRRVAAAKQAGLDTIPAIIRDDAGQAERMRQQLAENVERDGLTDLDQAAVIQQLLDIDVSLEEIAETVHTTPSNVQAWADLVRLPRKVRTLIDKGRIRAADAYPLVGLLDDAKGMRAALDRIDSGWTPDRAVHDVRREREQEEALAAAHEKLERDGTKLIDPPQWGSFSPTSKTGRLGKGHAEIHIAVRAHASLPCHAAYISPYEGIVYVCTNRQAHAGVDGSGVPDLKAERAAQRAQRTLLREANVLRFGVLRDAVRNQVIPTDTAVTYALRLSIDAADHRDLVTAVAMLDLTIPEGDSYRPERDLLLAHADSRERALLDVALALAVACGERSLTSERFDWRRTTVAEHVRFIEATGLHQLSDVEVARIKERAPRAVQAVAPAGEADAA
jgi:ParB/RepB/Spo0J family partition protein